MAEKKVAVKHVQRNDTKANWLLSNPTLLKGEIGIEIDTGKFKVGNGVDKYSTLPYLALSLDDVATESENGLMSSEDKTKLNAIEKGANKYTHPTTSGNKHIPSGGSAGQILRWSADGTAVWGADNNTTYSVATTSANGLMSSTDKSKLDGIATGATKTEASTTNGKIKINGTETTVYTHPSGTNPHGTTKSDVGLGNVDNTSDLNKPISTATQKALDGKANSSHTHDDRYYTESEIDTKLSAKANSSHTHTKSQITDFPTSLPANGGNADTVDGKHASDFATSTHTHSDYTTRINLTGQCQKTSYRKSVIALCKTSGTNTSTNSYSIGSLYLHRTNGLGGAINVDVSIECQYSKDGYINASIVDNSFSSNTKGGIRPCTFTYNGVNYGGVEIHIADAELSRVEFNGVTNFDIFALDYYQTNLSTPSLIDEITNSISYDKVSNTGNFRFNGHKVYHEGNKPTPADIGASSSTHTHDDRYYTESEINTKLNAKANTSHTHTSANISDATNANTANMIVKRDASGNFNAGTITASLSGNASTASKWATARTLTLTGGVTGSASIDGSGNVSLATTLAGHNQASNTITAMTGYAKASAVSAITTTDTLNSAIGKLEKALDSKQASGSYASSSHTHNYAGSSSAGGSATSALTCTGNSATATKLQTARTINGVSFDGSVNITVADSTKLPLSGGTLTGRLTANGKISLPTTGSSWISGKTLTNAPLAITTAQTTGSYHPILAVQTSSGNVANIGGLGDNVGFYGFKSDRTANGTDWSFVFNSSSGAVTSTGTITAPTFSGSLSGNASTATKLQTARTIFGKTFDGSGNVVGQALCYGTYTSTASSRYGTGALQIREVGLVGSAQSDIGYAPQIGFHWSGKVGATLAMTSGGEFQFINQAGTGYSNLRVGTLAVEGNLGISGTLGVTGTCNFQTVGIDKNLYIKVNNVATDVGTMLNSLNTTTMKINSYGNDTFGNNLDNWKTAGSWHCTSATTSYPNGDGWGTVLIYGSMDRLTQIYTSWNYSPSKKYIRTLNGSSWSAWQEIATTTKAQLTLVNGWTNYFGTTEPATISRVGNVVTIKACVKGGTYTTGTTIFTVPSDCIPSTTQTMLIDVEDSAYTASRRFITIYNDGRCVTNGVHANVRVTIYISYII